MNQQATIEQNLSFGQQLSEALRNDARTYNYDIDEKLNANYTTVTMRLKEKELT